MKLKELRTEAGLTLVELAARSGNDQTFLSRIERGKRSLTVERALRIAAVLSEELGRRVTVEEVFGHHCSSSQATKSA